MRGRQRRQYARYSDSERVLLLKRAYPDATDELINIMKQQGKASRAALHYAAWGIGILVRGWISTRKNESGKNILEGVLMSDKQDEQVFELPGPQQGNPDPLADQKAYFAYWELKDRQRRQEAQRSGLSIYEKARQYDPRCY